MHDSMVRLSLSMFASAGAAGAPTAAGAAAARSRSTPIGWPRRRAPICCCTRTIRSIGIPGATRRWPRRRREKKLIFLSIGYSSCYWCHVMERESRSWTNEIAAALNKNFVCIKVDREERPDIDEIYMQALHVYLQLVGSKQGGGWPLSMFLTPDAKPLMGGTYFPPRDKDGRMGFLTVLDRVQRGLDSRTPRNGKRPATRWPTTWPKACGSGRCCKVAEARAGHWSTRCCAALVQQLRRHVRRLRLRSRQPASRPSFPSRRTWSFCSTMPAATRARRPRRCC